MPRSKPTRKIDKIGTFDLNPESCTTEYLISRKETAIDCPPVADCTAAGDPAELLHLHYDQEHSIMLDVQQEHVKNSKYQNARNFKHIRKFYETIDLLRKRLIEVNSFIKECADKKRNAETEIQEETVKQKKLAENIEKNKRDVKELTKFSNDLKSTLQEFKPYEEILKEVVEKFGMFESVKDCMDRCDALMLAQVEISELEHEKLQEIENMNKHMVNTTNEAALAVLGLKNDLTQLERMYNHACNECAKWENILSVAQNSVTNNNLSNERAREGIFFLYQLLCKNQNRSPRLQRVQVEQQLDFIVNEVDLLFEIYEEIQNRNQ